VERAIVLNPDGAGLSLGVTVEADDTVSCAGMADHVGDSFTKRHGENTALWVVSQMVFMVNSQCDGRCFEGSACAVQFMLEGSAIHARHGIAHVFQGRSGNLRNVL